MKIKIGFSEEKKENWSIRKCWIIFWSFCIPGFL